MLKLGLDEVDKKLLDKYLKELCLKEAEVLKRQRGNAYGFGSDEQSSELLTKQLSGDNLEKAPTHTKQVENLFGNVDMILSRFGPQSFNKSSDDIVIKYSSDLLDNTYDWASHMMRRLLRKLRKSRKNSLKIRKLLLLKV